MHSALLINGLGINVRVVDSVFDGNMAPNGIGVAIHMFDNSQMQLEDAIIINSDRGVSCDGGAAPRSCRELLGLHQPTS